MPGGAEIAGALLEVLIFSGPAPLRPVEVLDCDGPTPRESAMATLITTQAYCSHDASSLKNGVERGRCHREGVGGRLAPLRSSKMEVVLALHQNTDVEDIASFQNMFVQEALDTTTN